MNELFLPEQTIPEGVRPTNDLRDALAGAEIVVSVMPRITAGGCLKACALI